MQLNAFFPSLDIGPASVLNPTELLYRPRSERDLNRSWRIPWLACSAMSIYGPVPDSRDRPSGGVGCASKVSFSSSRGTSKRRV
jgi:hypothetical protein